MKPDGTAGPELKDLNNRIESLAWSPDSTKLASVARDAAHVWNVDGTPVAQRLDVAQPDHVIWAADSRTAIVSGAVETVLWDTQQDTLRRLERRQDDDYTTALTWRPGAKEFARCDTFGAVDIVRDDGTLRISTGRSMAFADGLAIRPQGDRIATANGDGSVRLWDRQGRVLASCEGHRNRGLDAAWKADGSRLATAGADNTIRTWTMEGDPLRVLRTGSDQHQYAVAWDPKSATLAARGQQGIVRLWSGTDENPRELSANRGSETFISLAYSPDGKHLAADAPDGAWIWTRDRTGYFLAQPKILPADIGGRVAWRPDGQALALMYNVDVRILQLDGTVVAAFNTPASSRDIVWSPEGDALAFAGHFKGRVNVYTPAGQLLRSFTGGTSTTVGIDWSRDGELIVAGEDACTVRVWDADTGENQWVGLQLPDLENVSFTAAGQIIDGDIEVLDRRLICLVEQDDGRIELVKPSEFAVRFAPDWRVGSGREPPHFSTDFAKERAVIEWVHQQGGTTGITHAQQGYSR